MESKGKTYTTYELSCIYKKYIDPNCFLKNYLTHLSQEYYALREQFPRFLIDTTARIKSPSSYLEKIEKRRNQGRSPLLSDIYANKYILYSANGTSEEKALIDGVYQIRDFLADFNASNESMAEILESRKDYIKAPKDSGYQSLHLNFQSTTEPDLRFETQIKTFRMRQNELTRKL